MNDANKKILYFGIGLITTGCIGVAVIVYQSSTPKIKACTMEAKVCPDGTSVGRTGPNCEFTNCPVPKNEITSLATSTMEIEVSTSTNISTTTPIEKTVPSTNIPQQKKTSPSTLSKISGAVSSVITAITSSFKNDTPSVVTYYPTPQNTQPSTYINSSSSNSSVYKPLPPTNFAGEKYIVVDNNILSNDNKVIYTIPQEVIDIVSSSSPGWTNTTINVVPVGTVAPVLPNGAIPIADLPGKYYLSENSFGSIENCEFSNKIFILDIIANTATLMYEENSSTLSRDDPRACNSEIFLLATEGNKLVIKYHTIGTNSLCDSAWSEPEKTFFLDVTKLATEGMRKYDIPENLSSGAEQEEEACRTQVDIVVPEAQSNDGQ